MEENKFDDVNNELLEYTKKLLLNMPIVSALFRDGKTTEASQVFTQIIEGIEWIDKYISILASGSNKIIVNNKSVKEVRTDFMQTISSLLSDHKNKKWDDIANTIDNKLVNDLKNYLEIFEINK